MAKDKSPRYQPPIEHSANTTTALWDVCSSDTDARTDARTGEKMGEITCAICVREGEERSAHSFFYTEIKRLKSMLSVRVEKSQE